MVTINNDKKIEIKLVAVTSKSKVNDLVIKENFQTTLISSEKTMYMYFEKDQIDEITLKKELLKFAKTNKFDLSVQLDTFPIEQKAGLHAFLDAILYRCAERVTYKTTKQPRVVNYNITTSLKEADAICKKFVTIYKYKNFARDLQDMPPNEMYAEVFAKKVEAEAKKIPGLKITILDQQKIKQLKMGMLLAVNAGSARDARVVVLEYKGDPKSKEYTALVGKGITFDTGGISLKPSFAMEGMKYDMTGAAVACASVMSIASLKHKQNVCAVGCLTENQIGSTATIVESIVTSMNGKTVEITNTDAEGRLAVGDGICYAIRNLKATRIIEMSTLTGAILIALGNYMTGVFSNSDTMYNEFAIAAKEANEEIWRMPIHPSNSEAIRVGTIADIRNVAATRNGGSSIAAAFIQEFVEDKPFIHLDIAGTATEGRSFTSGTGVMIRTFVELFK